MSHSKNIPASVAADGGDEEVCDFEHSEDIRPFRPTQLRRAEDRSVRVAFIERDGRQLGYITWHFERGWGATTPDFGFMGFHGTALKAAKIVQGARP